MEQASRLGALMTGVARQMLVLALAFGLNTVILIVAREHVGEAYRTFYDGAFGNLWNFSRTLRWTTPLIFTGLAVSVAFRAGMFNVGAEGQLYLGAFAATWAAIRLTSLPKIVLVPIALAAAGVAGALWAALAG
ncbi:MAG: hypothetical protein AB1700_19935 [Bacillota bacterium]